MARWPIDAAGLFHFRRHKNLRDETCATRKAAKMKRTTQDIKRPYCGSDYQLVRAGRRGTYWQAPDGRCVQLVASDYESVVERSRVSIVAMLIALAATGAARSER